MRRIIRPLAGAAARLAVSGIILLTTPAFVTGISADQSRVGAVPCSGSDDFSADCSPPVAAKAALDAADAQAALKAIHLGLTEVGDGSTFVWHRAHGRLRGMVRPTSSFRDADGRVCRHLVVTLASGVYARTTEGVACRLDDRSWTLES